MSVIDYLTRRKVNQLADSAGPAVGQRLWLPFNAPPDDRAGFNQWAGAGGTAGWYRYGTAVGDHIAWDVPLTPGTWRCTILTICHPASGYGKFTIDGVDELVNLYSAGTVGAVGANFDRVIDAPRLVRARIEIDVMKEASATGNQVTFQGLQWKRLA